MTNSLAPLLALDTTSFRNTILEPRTMTLNVTYSEGLTFKTLKIKLASALSKHLMTLRKYKSGAGHEIFTCQILELVE
jgi:hypothetical protein